MKTNTRLPISLPDNSLNSESLRKAEPVGGPFTVTATLVSIDDILDWQEGRCNFDYGYYRFIDNPTLCQIQEGLQTYYQVRHCLLYTSFKTAAMELLDYLLLTKPQMRIKVVCDLEENSLASLEHSYPGLYTSVSIVSPSNASELFPLSNAKDEILVINVQHPLSFLKAHSDFLQSAKAARIPILVASEKFPEKMRKGPTEPETLHPLVNYWIFPLQDKVHPVTGGVILSKLDRQMTELKELRKQRGPILSSRDAAYFLGQIDAPRNNHGEQVIRRLCDLENAQHGFLFSSGMGAITTILSLLRSPGKVQIIVVGLLYTDTYALMTYAKQRIGRVENVFLGVEELDQLPDVINEQTAAIITETMTNPLSDVPDLETITHIAKQHHVPVIVDNTLATPVNCKPLDLGADYVIHSTTKYFNGKNNHGGGAILLNDTQVAEKIRKYQEQWGNVLSSLESVVLWKNLHDFEERMQLFQKNAIQIAEFLEQHPGVEKVYCPWLPSHRSYQAAQKILTGPGSVISFTLKQPGLEGLRLFYDAPLDHILKAPSLGSNQTILCPYTLLAHYHEPDDALAELELSRYLIRISVGCEMEIKPVMDSLDQALRATLT